MRETADGTRDETRDERGTEANTEANTEMSANRDQNSRPPREPSPSASAHLLEQRMSPRLVLLFAVATGVVVANLYYAQPLLDRIAHELGGGSGRVGQIVTLTQVGYAAGLFFLVPLGDLLERRRLVAVVLCGTVLALLAAGLAPTLSILLVASLAIGLTSVVAQVLVPFAATLAGEHERGAVVGRVMSGLLIGILLARTISGLVAQATSWRTMYLVAAGLMLVLIVVLWLALPHRAPEVRLSYGRLLRSVGQLALEEPILRRRAVYGALAFAAFSALWTSIAFLLARPPYSYSVAVIGLFGLVGAAGALCASFAGSLADRGLARYSTGVFLALLVASFVLIGFGAHALWALLMGIILLDLGAQGTQVTNQSVIYRLRPEARSRVTTAYMVTYFVGGAIGSAASAALYGAHGWAGVAWLGVGISVVALLAWLTEVL